MWKHYLKSAIRTIKANRTFSILNILGLAVGLTAGIILLLWTNKQTHYDEFHTKADRIYHLSASFTSNGHLTTFNGVPGHIAILAQNIQSVTAVVRIHDQDNQILTNPAEQNVFDGNKIGYIDSNFLQIFDFKRLAGHTKELLPNLNNIAITKQTSLKLFGTADALGKSVLYQGNTFIVSAVLSDFPENSTLQYDALLPMSYYAKQYITTGDNKGWQSINQDINSYQFATYVLLKNPGAAPEVAKQLSTVFSQLETSADIHFSLQNIQQMHLVTADGNTADLQMVHIMLLVGLLILLIASINYINLSTARSLSTSKEVGIRKIIGAQKGHLIAQFIVETSLIFLFALLLSVLLLWLSKPFIDYYTDVSIFTAINNQHTWLLLGLALLGTLLASSIYPAFLVASLHPLIAMSGKSIHSGNTQLIRKGLVIFQFGISFALLVATLIMHQQMQFVQKKDLGYNQNLIFIVPFPKQALPHLGQISNSLAKDPSIEGIGFASSSDISDIRKNTGHIQWPGQPSDALMMIGQLQVDQHFIPTLQYKFLEGRNFNGDSSDKNKYIVNKKAVDDMGLKAPYTGQTITFHEKKGEIIGVLKNFNFKPLNQRITPILLYSTGESPVNLYVRAAGNRLNQAIEHVKTIFLQYGDKTPFNYTFLDKKIAAHYQQQYRTGRLFNLFSIIAIFLSCLGLLGLITFAIQVRVKEIAVRKVLGASMGSLIKLMSKDFLGLVLIGSAIFVPLTDWWLHKWLQEFAYKIDLGFMAFLTSITLLLAIAFVTMGAKVLIAASVNPVKNLKAE